MSVLDARRCATFGAGARAAERRGYVATAAELGHCRQEWAGLAHVAGEATKCSARRSSRRRLANLKSLFELHLLQKQVGHQPSQP
jgi:hypothetical protein